MESATRLLSSDLELKLLGPPLPGAPPHLIHCTFDQLPESAKQKVREFIADHPEIPLPSPTPNCKFFQPKSSAKIIYGLSFRLGKF